MQLYCGILRFSNVYVIMCSDDLPERAWLDSSLILFQVLNEDVDVVETKAKDKGALVLGSGKGARRATRLGSTAALVLRNEAGGGRAELHSHEEAIQARIAFSSPTNDDKPFPSLHAIMTTCS